MTQNTNTQDWEKEFELQFNIPHPSGWHVLANDGKRPSECEICQKQGKYSLSGLTEGNYWNREKYDAVKSFISSLLETQREQIMKEVSKLAITPESIPHGSPYISGVNETVAKVLELLAPNPTNND